MLRLLGFRNSDSGFQPLPPPPPVSGPYTFDQTIEEWGREIRGQAPCAFLLLRHCPPFFILYIGVDIVCANTESSVGLGLIIT